MMKTITYEQFLQFNPCYLYDPKKKALMESIAQRRERWSALDILELSEIPAKDRLWVVLREALIDAPILHEFACRCAERALSRVENPDPRSVRAIEIKRAWIRGEATDDELEAAQTAAHAAAWEAAQAAAHAAAWEDAGAAARAAAWNTAWAAIWDATRDAVEAAAWAAVEVAAWNAVCTAAWAAERQWQIEILQKMLIEVIENG